ncbi:polysaccharide deacetylase family protein [Phyllobacterium sp. YR531]|uniref:polysaccharide deacetylase family protein n=1 Tax=Phyllobacterium sp. YR531 TaxID=1144343 RepID=UPI00026F6386|nr:polysaccharide deacetylase family protein [Phyllobacterium sp. YR531]EJN06217.1 Polysaccharide deacetylase [Phyllobacterium sp. YR531]
MTEDVIWQPLRDELSRWINVSRSVQFWLRDDDAVQPTTALQRLLKLGKEHGVPTLLAVIPALAGDGLADRLKSEQLITIGVHGWSHVNHAHNGEKKQELGPHRPLQSVLAELEEGRNCIEKLFPQRALPILVPPWNRIDGSLLPHLRGLGFAALSVFGPPKEIQTSHIPVVNTHVDLMDWHGTRGCRNYGDLVADIVREMRDRFSGEDSTIGILAHHLVHDEAAWVFLQKLFEITVHTGGCRWVSARELI